ncbi:MAG: metallophosphoesterase [Crenarchaeota archaeon]|nr:metallophosphoesterase [Thermoproteota archaeon]
MRILALTDIHDRLSRALKIVMSNKDIDTIIVAGDITHFGTLEEALNILRSLHESSGVKVFYVPGNCDDPRLLVYDSDDEIVNLHKKTYDLNGFTLLGIGGSNPTPFGTPIEFTDGEIREMLSMANDKGRGTKKIIVTHAPIYGINDVIGGVHVGSRVLREYLDKNTESITLWITGHLHEYRYVTRYRDTIIVNPGPAMRGFYVIVEVSSDRIKAELKRL